MRILEYAGLNISNHAAAYARVRAALSADDFRAADARKLVGLRHAKLYRAKLNYSDRLLFSLVKHQGETCAVMLEVIVNHAYERSRFLRGQSVDESRLLATGVPVTCSETDAHPLRYLDAHRSQLLYLDKPLSLDDTQDSIYRTAAPLIVVGGAGSGKTALTLEKLKCVEGEVQYVTLSAWLARSARLVRIPRTRLESEIIALLQSIACLKDQLIALAEREKSARYLAFHDELTGLPNRRFFSERLERQLATQGANSVTAILFLDLDGFKILNDTHGHQLGDWVLKIIARRLTYCVRAEDFVSRLGGDEYACLISGHLTRTQLLALARTLSRRITAPITFASGLPLPCVRASIGIAMQPTDGMTADALLKSADAAMYRAKKKVLPYAFAWAATEDSPAHRPDPNPTKPNDPPAEGGEDESPPASSLRDRTPATRHHEGSRRQQLDIPSSFDEPHHRDERNQD